jgi:hypothetical protein
LQEPLVNVGDDVRARDGEILVTILVLRATKVIGLEVSGEDGSSHRAVEQHDTLSHKGEQVLGDCGRRKCSN